MLAENDFILSQLTVRLIDPEDLTTCGTGVLYANKDLRKNIYIITAAHALYADGEGFKEPFSEVYIDFYNPNTNAYQSILHKINHSLVNPEADKDFGILVLDEEEVKAITGEIPAIECLQNQLSARQFAVKGFPAATRGKELVYIQPVWKQHMTGVSKFQLELKEDYEGWSLAGFSGGGVFLHNDHQFYLFGIFTRYREEGKGKTIYCQYISLANELLRKNFLPEITFTYLGEYGMKKSFFKRQISAAVKNLGPRFNEKLNFRLPIAELFHDLARDGVFKQRLTKIFDRWLTARNFTYYTSESEHLKKIESDYSFARKNVIQWLQSIKWEPDQKISADEILKEIDDINKACRDKILELYHLQYEEQKKEKEKKEAEKKEYNYDAHRPYEHEISRVREIERNNDYLLQDIETRNVILSNEGFLLIKGEAGCGKSHLLGDIATERLRNGKATILLLGALFRSTHNIWQNIISQLGLTCTKEQFLSTLERTGQQTGERTVILIDALNEGAGKELWHAELAGFIEDISAYPFIALCITVRSTYYEAIVPTVVSTDARITQITHEGFKGNEYEALKLFCIHHGLQQPNFPILAPEFANPLFLQLICNGVKNSKDKIFPQGFQGVSLIFSYYVAAIFAKLCQNKSEYKLKPKIVSEAIETMAKAMLEKTSNRVLSLEKAVLLFENKFPQHKELLADLIHESVFIQSIITEHESTTSTNVVYFAYERFGDFIMANELLATYSTAGEVNTAFKKENLLGKLLEDGWWRNRGILEAMAVILPERYNLEIVEVYGWAFKGKHIDLLGNIDTFLNTYLLDSLKWRTTESVNFDKICKWINGKYFKKGIDEFYNSMIGLTTVVGHPFNGDSFHDNIIRHTMPVRDSFLQNYFRFYGGNADDGSGFPIKRLIDWAWQPGISGNADREVVRLTGQTLSWVLSSTNRKLRDQTTKALVNLLEEQPEALIDILRAFKDIDDFYISERLYAVAYGCALRTSKDSAIKAIAQYTFDTIFKSSNPPVHTLLRDYARNIVEYAIYKKINIDGDLTLINPPYQTPVPDDIPSPSELKAYELDHKAPDFDSTYGRLHNFIKFSIMEWDFGEKTVESAFREFSPVSFRMEIKFADFLRKLKPLPRATIKYYASIFKTKALAEQRRQGYYGNKEDPKLKSISEQAEQDLAETTQHLQSLLNDEQYSFFIKHIIPHIASLQRRNGRSRQLFDANPIKRWMVKKAYDLGYDKKLHGSFDHSVDRYGSEQKVERIGQKYEWISLHQAVAIVADNYKTRYDTNKGIKYDYYKGPWQRYLRDIHVSYVTRNSEMDQNEPDHELKMGEWWSDINYAYWNIPDAAWLTNLADLPDVKHIIEKTDPKGESWLYLNQMVTWEEPKPIGVEKYDIKHKELWYLLQGYLVKKNDKAKVISWMKKQDFGGGWMPQSHEANLTLMSRENFWSPASATNLQEKWEYLPGSRRKVMIATSEAAGNFSKDKSEAHLQYVMPCKLLFEGMGLRYGAIDSNFINTAAELIVTKTDGKNVLINKTRLIEFLDENDLDIVWGLLGEKEVLGGDRYGRTGNLRTTISGVYFLENNKLTGHHSLKTD